MTTMARIYDPEKQTTHEVPERELADGYIRAIVPSLGQVWIEASKVKASMEPVRGPLPPEQRRTCERFAVVYPRTPDEWEEGFRADRSLDRELPIWRLIERQFLRLTAHLPLGPANAEKRKDIFRLVVGATMNGLAAVHVIDARTVSRTRKEQIVKEVLQAGAADPVLPDNDRLDVAGIIFDRGIVARLDSVLWVADAPYGS